jgi:hypothetical protein
MNGFQLYRQYMEKAERSERESAEWKYGQVLNSAYYLVGVTRLFDTLEEAEALGCRIGLQYSLQGGATPPVPCDIELITVENTSSPFTHQHTETHWPGFLVY